MDICCRVRLSAWFVFVATSLSFTGVHGQIRINDAPTCRSCRVAFEPMVELGGATGESTLPGHALSVTRDARGHYWLSFTDGTIMIFDAAGRLMRSVERVGEGPNEFRSPSILLAVGDSVVVLDDMNQRASVIWNYNVVRTVRLPGRVTSAAIVRWPAEVFIHSLMQQPATAGWPLHIWDLSGAEAGVRRSFGLNAGDMRPGSQRHLLQVLDVGADGTLWSAERMQYRVTSWNVSGAQPRTLVRNPVWFPGVSTGLRGGRNTPPAPSIAAIRADSAGNVWVFTYRAAPTWRDAWSDVPRQGGSGTGEVPANVGPDPLRLFATTIEVLSYRDARLIVQHTTNEPLVSIDNSTVARYVEGPTGELKLQIMRVSIR